jgi:hypothetical protein
MDGQIENYSNKTPTPLRRYSRPPHSQRHSGRLPRRRRAGPREGLRPRPPVPRERGRGGEFCPLDRGPTPEDAPAALTYLHEAVHIVSSIPSLYEGNNYSSSEAEAELGALRALESEGLFLSLCALRTTRRRIEYEARKDRKEFGAEYSPLVLECLAEFDRRIAAVEKQNEMQTCDERAVARGIRDRVKEEYGMAMGRATAGVLMSTSGIWTRRL